MKWHPSLVMLGAWGVFVCVYLILPFQLLDRQITSYGVLLLGIFMLAFVLGTFSVPRRRIRKFEGGTFAFNTATVERVFKLVAGLASIFLVLDVSGKPIFDLTLAYALRSETADALLKAEASSSSVWFQLAFLLYPASYVYLAIHVIHAKTISAPRLLIFGIAPVLLATLSMGGRMPIFYAAMVIILSYRERKRFLGNTFHKGDVSSFKKWMVRLVWLILIGMLFLYFVSVFVARASAGGAEEMFAVAEERWHVGFRGPFSDVLFDVFGYDFCYLIFIFSWYLVQGVVMSNFLLSDYEGPMQMGVYGIDLISAIMRRYDPQSVALGFDSLLTLGTYGFFPSAWGSMYVDFGFFSVVPSFLWGVFCGLAYQRIVLQRHKRWAMVGPFVTIGLIFSVVNTPLGFTNGLVTHIWLGVAFILLRQSESKVGQPSETSCAKFTRSELGDASVKKSAAV